MYNIEINYNMNNLNTNNLNTKIKRYENPVRV